MTRLAASGILLACLLATLAGCGSDSSTAATATPTFSPAAGTYATAQDVTIACATAGAVIHYTTDGSAPTASSPTYASPVHVAASETLSAYATASGSTDSAVATAAYTISAGATPAATATFSPVAGTYTAVQAVTIASSTTGASLYYTTDGSTPTTASTPYAAPVQVAASETLKAIATATGHTASAVASAAYVINLPQAAAPTFTPGAGTYSAAQSVTIASATAGAAIRYTTDGSAPTVSSTLYTGPVTVSASETLTAIATATGYTQSAAASAAYVINSGGGTDFNTFCAQARTKIAQLEESCLSANPALFASPGGPYNRNNCSGTAAEITAGRVTYDATLGASCVSGVQAMTCAALVSGFPSTCTTALTGTVAANGTCYIDADCASGYCTAAWTSTCPGTCQPRAASGASCDSAACASGLVCDHSVSPSICKTPSAAGGACPCNPGLWCNSSGASPVCAAAITSGGSCTASSQCVLGLVCVGTPKTCQAVVGASGNCAASADLCGPGYTCTSGSCVAWPTAGQPCSTAAPYCSGGYCPTAAATPTCQAYIADGATCNPSYFGQDCGSGSCNSTSQKCNPAFCGP